MRRRPPGTPADRHDPRAFLFLALLALAGGCRTGERPATAPGLAAPSVAGPITLLVVWGAEPDQERYRAQVETETRAALARAGVSVAGGPTWRLRIDKVTSEAPYENDGTPLPGQERTPLVTVRPRAVIEAVLIAPTGATQAVTGNWGGVFRGRDPDAYLDMAFQQAGERTAERTTAVIVRSAR